MGYLPQPFLPTLTAQINKDHSFNFYSSSDRQDVTIYSLADWETQRWKIKKGMEAVMGPLPVHDKSSSLALRIIDTLEKDNYQRLNIQFNAATNEPVHAFLYLPKRAGIKGGLPAMLALHPTGKIGKKIVDGQGKPNRGYAKELAERGYVVMALTIRVLVTSLAMTL